MTEPKTTPVLGETAKDSITGYRGIVYAEVRYLTGNNQLGLLGESVKEDGSPRDVEWFDTSRVELVKE